MPRPAGAPNKNKRLLTKRLQEMYGEDFNPVIKMAENCVTLQKIADAHAEGGITVSGPNVVDAHSSARSAIDAWDKVAQYIEPKLKAMEVTGQDGERFTIETITRRIVDPKE